MADPAFCSDPDPVTGFILSSDPADGGTGVPLSTTTLSVTFINPMLTAGGGNVLDPGNYYNGIDNMTLRKSISITGTRYEASTKTVFLTIDTGNPDWQSGCEYRVQITSSIRNACKVMQNIDGEAFFTTE